MAIRSKRGLGSAGNTALASECNSWLGYVDPLCWGYNATTDIARSVTYPELPAMSAPPVVGSTLPDGSPIPAAPASGEDASAIVQSITDQQITAMQAQNQGFFSSLNQDLNKPGNNLWLFGGLALLGVFALSAMGGGSARRYGR